MSDLQATARAAQVGQVSSGRGAVERFGLFTIAAGIVIATLVAWLLTKAPWSWAHETGIDSPPMGSLSEEDLMYSLSHTYAWERHIAAEGALYIGIGFVVLGVVITLVGKAMQRNGSVSI